ncbi:UDP-N-acetylglucosamine 4,6-dehydratase (inverting) [Micromonospora sp. RTGN7]|uniref:UDP-N-acetylglucosamine 4,6-dehydratase (inverting) n=1 Tax=Micromonospora sp. RTGN7 TaxID=3016526 RepID=UPI0029FEC955|nr:UDP-N-acetylglucosamine 4,6-dehydratase (inverting) [Micromonospora sp. RTGN7]
MSVLRNSTILVTGGTGSFGKAFVQHALAFLDPELVLVYSRDELKQYEIRQHFPAEPRLRPVIGDIRDRDRLTHCMRGVDFVVHAAALKQVDTAEGQGFEFVKTNVVGSQNVIDAALANGVRQVVALSTDKASSPINLYGATKMVADKLFTSSDGGPTRFSVVRYGNVMGSRGSVIPLFQRLGARTGASLPITDKRMTRYLITLDEAVRFVVETFDVMRGGELYVPKIPSVRISDLAEAIAPGCPTYEVGIRPGEKVHEELIAAEDSQRTFQSADRYVVMPTIRRVGYLAPEGCRRVEEGFRYRSDLNSDWLGVEELRALVELIDGPGEPCAVVAPR